jgi:hypothetical protein
MSASAHLLGLQMFLAFAVANARNDSSPRSGRPWLPANLPNYDRRFRLTAGADPDKPLR